MELEFDTNGLLDDAFYETGGDIDVAGLENERCGICMDGIIDRGVLDCCEHWFCFACIDNWATITNLCPLCQNEFQLITCVPVYDTIGSGKVEDDSLSRDDDWCIQGTNNTLSFPSYYIDENAVICLDGNGCKIRNKVATSGDDSILDTSIACDSCDIWYHAFCVDFDPEGTSENSWLCPRCIDDVPPQKSDGLSMQMPKNQYGPETASREHSVEASHSGNVSVSVADAGETAVVVSMIEGKHWIKDPNENSLPAQDINQSIQTMHKKSNTKPYVDAEENLLALSLSQETHVTVPCDSLCLSEFETTLANAVSEPNVSDSGLFSGLLSDKPNFESELPEIESDVDLQLGLSMGCSSPADKMNRVAFEDHKSEVSQPQTLFKDLSVSVENICLDANEDAAGSSCLKRKSVSPRDHVLATEHPQAGSIFSVDETVADPPSKKAKCDGESQKTRLNNEDRILIPGSSKECFQLPADLENKVDRIDTKDEMVTKFPAKKAKVDGKSQQSRLKREVKKSIPGGTQEHAHPSAASKDDTPRDVPEQEDKTPVSTSVLRGTTQRLSGRVPRSKPTDKPLTERENGSGLRVKKIMRRTAENESSKLVENLRKEIREAVRSKTATDFTKSNLFDPKLLLAFRNAVAGPRPEHEPVQKLNPSIVRAKKSLLQKGKIRDNLTKKIYGNSNGRRKRAWDRDWEVEFWKHRCKRATKPEKVETLMSVLDLLRKGSESSEIENEPGEETANPILSRLYLADTSVLPRNDDIKPLSVLTGTANDLLKKEHNVKENVSKPVNDNCASRTPPQISKNPLQFSKDEASCKKISSSGSTNNQNSTSMESVPKVNDQSLKETPGISGVKNDKRKWALEVLARKNSTVQRNTTEGKVEDSIMLKGNFPLLAQLPPDMKPVLAPSRHNKIPLSVRQAQLYRLAEHLLRKADLPVIRRTADTELAVVDAVNIEKDVVNRSNSKLVYINLCSQVVSQHMNNKKPDSAVESDSSQPVAHGQCLDLSPKESSNPDSSKPVAHAESTPNELSDLSTEAALRLAGLVSDSPPDSPLHADDNDSGASVDGDKGPDNIFDIDTHVELDIYGDFEYDLENEDYIGGNAPKISKPHTEEVNSKMKVVFSTLSIPKTDAAMDPKDNERLEIINEPKDSRCHELHKDVGVSTLDIRTESSCPAPESLNEEICGEPSLAECEELYGPDKEPLADRFPITSGLLVACDSPAGENSSIPSLVSEKNLQGREKKTNTTKQSDIIHSVSKKVETYIKEHIRPLCKSGVITVEQYRWAVERTTTKIMKYHSRDTNANFLVKEGEKVKKLAEQYVEAAQKKDGS